MAVSILTLENPRNAVLHKKTEDFSLEELPLASEIASLLKASLLPLMPAAGLAAPQIGISRSIFIYSFDRQIQNLKVVLNPTYEPLDNQLVEGWEGCFSARLENGGCKVAKLTRYEKIQVGYLTLEGELKEEILEAFEAKVFQHETDHLRGIFCVSKEGAETKTFDTNAAFIDFMLQVKKEDAERYKK